MYRENALTSFLANYSTKAKILVGIGFVSFFVNFVYLNYPNSVVFDEVHFGKFTNSYCCTQKRIFDIHPPHAKLLISAFVGLFTSYDGGFSFDHIGQEYGYLPIFWFRFFPALCGSLIPLLAFILLLEVPLSLPAATLGAFLLIFDNSLRVQSRVISLDGFLILMMLLAIFFAIKASKAPNQKVMSVFTFASGIAAGCAVGAKITGLVGISIPLLWLMILSVNKKSFSVFLSRVRLLIWFFSGAGFIYLLGWYIHFQILNLEGPGDAFYRPIGSFVFDAFGMQKVMVESNVNLTKGHSYASKWWTWPFSMRGVFYWVKDGVYLFFLPNPISWIGVSITILFASIYKGMIDLKKIFKLAPVNFRDPYFWLFTIAYWNSYLPYMKVSRALFLYHYMPCFVFAVLAVCIFLDQFDAVSNAFKLKHFYRSPYWIALALIFLGFMVMVPLTYGIGPKVYFDTVFRLVPSWR